jgi:uncharacterized protein (DUF1697 family)
LERTARRPIDLVVFLRGVNVGGHRRFRPSLFAKELAGYDVVNIGATGLLVASNVRSRLGFQAELLRKLPFEVELALCDGRELLELEAEDPFGSLAPKADVVRFVSVLLGAATRRLRPMPLDIPSTGQWYVRLIGQHKRFVYGVYRRHMKTIGYLGRIDDALAARVTTRNWNTIRAVTRVLKRRRQTTT